ncbi:LpqB family beta-propeller domain-containing protein [Saccharopolyspora sp. NFXS83]|uniref:LpqB family beta-propeller domain-containing protein n=1 Tax=Saccharopolyspora sp. NFXS83 TaxID=2993560 RepID=UPI00224A531F|nr:LpqB family beta-propeller domain-containing protein [Saccharopolyspora sp. NFXS83]MCX2733918.1 LpqB family beta-propeller domain-containing protein [Saccharopolyspora sp. NFXS83]
MTRRRLAVLVLALLPLGACASIPERSDPMAVQPVVEGNAPGATMPEPPRGVNSFDLVRSFADTGSTPESGFAAAKEYLTDDAERRWEPDNSVLIVDNIDTIPVPPPPNQPENVQLVSLQADRVGRLRPDASFVPETGPYEVQVRVERNREGQWRIASPPEDMVISRASFKDGFMAVPIYFADHDGGGVVPDLRWVGSQPEVTLPQRVIELLIAGPSEGFKDAMASQLPRGASTKTNVSEDDDGALVVNLSGLGEPDLESRQMLAAQVVLSLQNVSKARVRLQEEGVALLPGKRDLQPADVESYESDNAVSPGLPGLAVIGERLHVLDENVRPIPGPAGSGALEVVQAAQSGDGSRLAAVARKPSGMVGLRVGPYGEDMSELQPTGSFMSRPTWRGDSEVWAVVNGRDVFRAVDEGGSWGVRPVDVGEFSGGRQLTQLRLSHDGTRAAGVVDGRIVVGAVVDEDGRVALRHPVTLGADRDFRVTGVDWLTDKSLVAATDGSSPVMEVTVDGFDWTEYASANLTQPINAVTVGPGKRVVVADQRWLWEATASNAVWSVLPGEIEGNSLPFFPG